MKRLKKKKNPKKTVDKETYIRLTNYLTLATAIKAMWDNNTIDDKETRREDAVRFVEAFKIYLQEVADKRQTVFGAVNDCEELTGIDVIEVIDEVFGGELI